MIGQLLACAVFSPTSILPRPADELVLSAIRRNSVIALNVASARGGSVLGPGGISVFPVRSKTWLRRRGIERLATLQSGTGDDPAFIER